VGQPKRNKRRGRKKQSKTGKSKRMKDKQGRFIKSRGWIVKARPKKSDQGKISTLNVSKIMGKGGGGKGQKQGVAAQPRGHWFGKR